MGESKSSHYIPRMEEKREGVILPPELLGNKTVKNSCPCEINVLEREIDNNYKAYQGPL